MRTNEKEKNLATVDMPEFIAMAMVEVLVKRI